MARGEDVSLRLGSGRLSGSISILLGVSCFLGVLCFHFPEYLTTPELRQTYDVEIMRDVLLGAMLLSCVFGSMTFFLWKSKRLGFIGLMFTLAAQWLGGANVYVDEFEQPAVSFGVDFLVLNLVANTLVFVVLERSFPHNRVQRVLRKEWRLDFVYYVFNHVMVSVTLLITTAFSEKLFGWAVNAQFQDLIRSQPVWLQFVVVLFVADFTQYWGHRLMHENQWLWNFHAVHHCPEEMDWLSGSRMHFAEVLFTRSSVLLPIYLLGFAENAVNGYVIWIGIQAVLNHANVRLPFGPLKYVIATPHYHHWHHAADAEAIDRNFAASLPVLDMIFGTYIGNHDRWPERYGVVGKELPRGFLMQHLYPFIASPSKHAGARPGDA